MEAQQGTQPAPVVSVIVPVYNAEAFLAVCVGSIRAQSFPRWELILVDDGSTDGSPELCDGFAAADGRIRVVHRENGGVGAARNAGLELARGEYVAFADADDVLPQDSLQARLACMEGAGHAEGAEGAQAVDFVIARYGEFSDVINSAGPAVATLAGTSIVGVPLGEMPTSHVRTLNRRDGLLAIIVSGEARYQGYVHNKLFRRSIIRDAGLRFATDIAYNEDRLFCTEYALRCEVTALSNDMVYWYRRHEASIMGALAKMTDDRAARYLSEFVAYDRIMALVEAEFPDFAHYVAADALYRAVNLRRQVPGAAPVLRGALEECIVRYGTRALDAPRGQFGGWMRAKMRLHVALRR